MFINKVYVGVLYSGENEYGECLETIKAQTYSNFDLSVYEHLPKLEAHKTLYHAFLDQKNVYDFLIKIDADMVLTSPLLFEKIVNKFNQNPWMDVLGIAITDFFSGGYINGLNSYRNTVKWKLDREDVNADTVIVEKEHYLFDEKELAPAAIHCKNPSKFQAFHYGVHRGLKSIAQQHSTSHWALLEKTWKNFLRTQDVRIGLAILGAELVYAGKVTKEDVDYTNPRVEKCPRELRSLDSSEIRRMITEA